MNISQFASNFYRNRVNAFLAVVGLFFLVLLVMGGMALSVYIPAWTDSRKPVDILGVAIDKQVEGDTSEAKKLYTRTIIKSAHDSPTLYHANRGLMQIALKEENYKAAENYMVRASQAIVVYHDLFIEIVEAYKSGPLKDSRGVFEQALEVTTERFPRDTNFSIALGSYYRDIDNREKAIEWYQYAIDNGTSNAALLQAEIESLRNE